MDGDTFTEEVTEGWGSRLGDSCSSVVGGIVFVFVGMGLLFWNEGEFVAEKKALNEGLAAVVSLPDIKTVDPAYESKLIHVTGTPDAQGNVTDDMFGINLDGPLKLYRSTEMYAWEETERRTKHKNTGGSTTTKITYEYNKKWTARPESSSSFKKAGYDNPPMPFGSDLSVADDITLGAFTLSDAVIEEIDFFEDLEGGYSVDSIPAETKAKAENKSISLYSDDGYYFGANPSSPAIGDLRVTIDYVPAEPISVVALQFQKTLTTYTTKKGRSILLVQKGIVPATKMFEDAKSQAWYLVMGLRIVGFVVIWASLQAILEPLSVFADVLPILGDFVEGVSAVITFFVALGISLFMIAIAWLFYRPLISLPILAVVIGGAVYSYLQRKKSREAAEGTESEPLV